MLIIIGHIHFIAGGKTFQAVVSRFLLSIKKHRVSHWRHVAHYFSVATYISRSVARAVLVAITSIYAISPPVRPDTRPMIKRRLSMPRASASCLVMQPPRRRLAQSGHSTHVVCGEAVGIRLDRQCLRRGLHITCAALAPRFSTISMTLHDLNDNGENNNAVALQVQLDI